MPFDEESDFYDGRCPICGAASGEECEIDFDECDDFYDDDELDTGNGYY